MLTLQLCVILACLLLGTRYGGMGLGLISGIGLFILCFVFNVQPGKPPVDVILTILAVIGCAATLQTAGGLDVLMRVAERLLRKHPEHITLLAPITTWFLTLLCGTGHVAYTMFPIIYDIAINKGIRPERPMAVASVSAQIGICASPVSVAVVSMVSMLGQAHGVGTAISIVTLLAISIPSTFVGVLCAGLWSMHRGKDLDKDPEFQKRLADPETKSYIYGGGSTLLDKVFPPEAYRAVWFFFAAIAAVVILGAFADLRPSFGPPNKLAPLSMNIVIQMIMLIAGACILMFCKVKQQAISSSAVFKAGMVAIFSVFGVAWMTDSFFHAHLAFIKTELASVVTSYPWTYALVLVFVSKLVNSQAAALAAVVPLGLSLGLEPKLLLAFMPMCYGYFILPTYPSDLACINFDRSGTTCIGKFIINHSFIIPGAIGITVGTLVSYALVMTFL